MALLTKQAILEAKDMKQETVSVPDWGGEVLVKGLTGRERDQFESSMMEVKGKTKQNKFENLRAKLVALSIINEDGTRMFTDNDVIALGNKSAACLDLVFDAAQRLSGLKKEDVEEMTKNSENDQSADSTLDSPPSGDVA